MIKVSILYPNTEGSTFDLDYYCNSHIPMVAEKLGAALMGYTVEQGLSGGAPQSQPTYIAMGHLLFNSLETFQAAIAPHNEAFMADIPNYTNIKPIMQISEVKVSEWSC